MGSNILAFIIGLALCLCLGPFVIKISKRLKASQTILHYVKEHSEKQGTPTMGGVLFIVGCILSSLLFLNRPSTLALVTLVVTLGFGILGFLDDFIKVKYKQNEGLKPYQKIIGQVGISLLVAIFVYNFVGSDVLIPFTLKSWDLGWFIIPVVMFVFIAVVNSVNLIDGLDGLSTGVTIFFVLGFVLFFSVFSNVLNLNDLLAGEYSNLITVCYSMLGCLLAFLFFNCFPAKIFMGDTGSLALGGFITCICIFTKTLLFIPILGIMYVITALSDIIQVIHYKRTKKRVFLMAPLHHHFQKKGVHENRIVAIYMIITAIMFSLNILITYLANGGL